MLLKSNWIFNFKIRILGTIITVVEFEYFKVLKVRFHSMYYQNN